MDKYEKDGSRVKLVVSIVLHSPERMILGKTLHSLARALEDCCDTLEDQTKIILVDHSSKSISPDWLHDFRNIVGTHARMIYAHVGTNPGFGAGHNYAFSRISGANFFLVANPDLEFSSNSLTDGLAFLDKHSDVGLLAPALTEEDGGIRPACFRYPDLTTLLARLVGGSWSRKRSFRYECRDWNPDNTCLDPPLISGCCMLFRASLFDQLGGFDPRYFLYFEDFDISLRANQFAHTAYYPRMKISHTGGGAGRKGIKHLFLYFRSAFRFFSTYGWLSSSSTFRFDSKRMGLRDE